MRSDRILTWIPVFTGMTEQCNAVPQLSLSCCTLVKSLFDVATGRDRGGGPVAGRCDRLARRVLADIADGVEAVAPGLQPVVCGDMAAFAQLYDAAQKCR